MITLKTLAERYSYWNYFFELSSIPRPSSHPEKVCAWVLAYVSQWNLKYKQDDYGNITVWVPANKPAYNTHPLLTIQAHLDMVCEVDEKKHDFMTDPLDLMISDDEVYVTANGTTLGADDGIGVAYQMALMDPDCPASHGPLELLFTLDEEIGLVGASKLGEGMVTSSLFINIDNSREGMCCNGCAGGKNLETEVPIIREAVQTDMQPYILEVKGLAGGHSGSDIYDLRATAIKLIERVYSEMSSRFNTQVESIESGDKHNAIPRSAKIYCYAKPADISMIRTMFADLQGMICNELLEIDQGFVIQIHERAHDTKLVLTGSSLKQILKLIRLCPHGVFARRSDTSEGTMISTNLASIHTEHTFIQFVNSARFSNAFGRSHIMRMLETLFIDADAKIQKNGEYAAWEVAEHSMLEQAFCKHYEAHTGKQASIGTIHGGLECGIIKALQNHPLDVISIGPTVDFLHSPSERMHIESCDIVWNVIADMLQHANELKK